MMTSKLPLSLFIYTALLCCSCSTTKNNKILQSDPLVINQRSIVYSSLIKKPFMKKNGTQADYKEFYLMYNNESYFIKLCESQLSRQTVETLYSSNNKVFTFEVELAKGEWDICDENYEQQSRIGEYILLHSLIK